MHTYDWWWIVFRTIANHAGYNWVVDLICDLMGWDH